VEAGAEQITDGEPSVGSRLVFLLVTFAAVLAFEAGVPLFVYRREERARNIGRNVAMTGIFLGVNLLLHPLSPSAAKLTLDARFGLSYWLGLQPIWYAT